MLERKTLVRPPQSEVIKEDKFSLEYQAFRGKILIDKNKLDEEIERQAQIFLEVSEQYAKAASQRDKARDILARCDSQIAKDERLRLTKAGEKTNDSIINDNVILDFQHQKFATEYAELKHAADLWGNLKEAFEQRMRMLRELVNLYTTSYWNQTSIRADPKLTDAMVAQIRARQDEHRKERNKAES